MHALTNRHYQSKRVAALLRSIALREKGIEHRARCRLLEKQKPLPVAA